jgi:hypothetical protein
MSTTAFIHDSEAIEGKRDSDFAFETYQLKGRSFRSIQAKRNPCH